ncbi:DUF397 domain-containing protein [Streptomyces sp. NPDC002506]|uniref:DUF397 domain-containing protein n=1 Tax=Streptomyces sp. NPDC002506 TaxID=3154536 RepID=UPI003321B170
MNTHLTAPEVAPEEAWYKSSYSSDQGGSCIEIAKLTGQVGIRDSKDKSGPALVVPTTAWSSFVGFAKVGGNEAC